MAEGGFQNPFLGAMQPTAPVAPLAPAGAPPSPITPVQPGGTSNSGGSSIMDYLPTGGTGILGAIFGGLHAARVNDLSQQFEQDLTNNVKALGPQKGLVQTFMSNPNYLHRLPQQTLANAINIVQAAMKPAGQVVQGPGGSVGMVSQDDQGNASLTQLGNLTAPIFQVQGNQVVYAPTDNSGKPLMDQKGNPIVKVTQLDPTKADQFVDLGGTVRHVQFNQQTGQWDTIETLYKTATPVDHQATTNETLVLSAIAAGADPNSPALKPTADKYGISGQANPAAAAAGILDQFKFTQGSNSTSDIAAIMAMSQGKEPPSSTRQRPGPVMTVGGGGQKQPTAPQAPTTGNTTTTPAVVTGPRTENPSGKVPVGPTTPGAKSVTLGTSKYYTLDGITFWDEKGHEVPGTQ